MGQGGLPGIVPQAFLSLEASGAVAARWGDFGGPIPTRPSR